MRPRPLISAEQSSARVNVTPMIDIVMVLIVFYLLVGQLALDRRAAITLPRTATGVDQTTEIDPIVIGITADGDTTLNGQPIEPDRLPAQVSGILARDAATPVRVRADRDAPMRDLRPVLDTLRDLGVGGVELVTEQQP